MRLMTMVLFFVFMCSAALCQRNDSIEGAVPEAMSFAKSYVFFPGSIRADIDEFAASPHAFGSERQLALQTYLRRRTTELGTALVERSFVAQVPNLVLLSQPSSPADLSVERRGLNLWALPYDGKDKSCAVVIASHYDSKDIAGVRYRGANDSGSSSAALLALIPAVQAYHKLSPLKCQIMMVWFDGEEAVLPNWSDGERIHPAKIVDNTYGSRFEAESMRGCGQGACLVKDLGGFQLKALILLDMVGSPEVKISRDLLSSPTLLNLALGIDKEIYPDEALFAGEGKSIEDDHIPFRQRGIQVLNLIDFENLSVWHRAGDDPESVKAESVAKVSRMALALALSLASDATAISAVKQP